MSSAFVSFRRFFFGCIALLAVFPTAFAFQKAAHSEELPPVDKRARVSKELSAAKQAALGQLKAVVPGARVTFHEKLGTPAWVASPQSFLTGPKGLSKAGRVPVAPVLPENTPYRPVKAFLNEHSALYGYGPAILDTARVKRSFASSHNGVQTTVWEQQVDGIPVYESVLIGHVTANQELINLSSSFVPDPDKAAVLDNQAGARDMPALSVEEAVVLGAQALGVTVFQEEVMELDMPQGDEKRQYLAAGALPGYVNARLVWFPVTADRLRLAWRLELTQPFPNERYRVLIDARTGELLLRRKLTLHYTDAQYRVYTGASPAPLRPGHAQPSTNQAPFAPRAILNLSALGTNASPLGWLNDHANDTRGNNVDAHLDRNADDLPDLPRPLGVPARTFDFAMDAQLGPESYQEASVVQLFYWCNWMHDQLYELGFTEAAGNFQKDNLGRGGQDNDAVIADAQDGSGVNNANFTPTEDGEAPRIQMYIFDGPTPKRDGSFDAEIVLHEYTHGLSTRLVGGGLGISQLQPAGMGEGWSDFYALALLTQPGEDPDAVYPMSGYATYQFSGLTENYYFGIRRYPYCTDMTKNPLTLKDIDPNQIDPHVSVPISPIHPFSPFFANEVHYAGEVWCVTLWEARANLVKKYGVMQGNRLILQLVTDGMKLSPPNPTFLEARDAILQADLLNNSGANWLDLWTAFAKRGMGFSAWVPTADSTTAIREAYDLPDAMLVLSPRNFIASGAAGGPFVPACMTYVITNTSTNTIVWSSVNYESWLKIEPAGGPLAPRSAVQVSVCLTPEANTLPVGVYEDKFAFRNNATGLGHEREASLRITDFAALPFSDGFESGSLGSAWQTTGTGIRRTQVTGNNNPRGGKFHVTMDTQEFIESYARNELTLGLDLGGYTNVVLQFWARSYGDEPDGPPPAPFLEGANFDGVAISQDGIRWYEVAGLRSLNNNYQKIQVALDPIVLASGLSYSPEFRIRFNQYDNLAIPYDGIALDDVSVTGVAARRMWLQIPSEAKEGDSVVRGTVRLAVPAVKPISIQLQSSDRTKVTLPANVILPAGATNVDFDLVIVDNSLLDGTQKATVSATAAGYYSVPVSVDVLDNEKAALKLNIFPMAREGSGVLKKLGRVTASRRVDRDTRIQLFSSHPGLLAPPAFVVLKQGEKTAEFEIAIVDGATLDGRQQVTITAHVPNWTDGTDTVSVADNDRPQLFVAAPARVSETDGILLGVGEVRLAASVNSNLTVQLASSDPVRLTVPVTVEIPANAFSAPFSLKIRDNPVAEGPQLISITATVAGFSSGTSLVSVLDNETPPIPYGPSPAHLSTNVPVETYLSWQAGVGEVIVNGGFETGDFTGWRKEDIEYGTFVINDGKFDPDGPDGPLAPYEGKYNAMTAQIGGGSHLLYQDLFIPVDAESATLSWAHRIRNHGTQFDDVSQVFRVEIRDTANMRLATAFSTQPGDPLTNNWVRRQFDLSDYRGQWLRVAFFQEDHLGYFNVHVDDVSVRLGTATNMTFDVYFGTNPNPGQAEYLGATNISLWKLPRLALDTTYYWRVVSKLGSVPTAGPVWQFSTRGIGTLDHFEWGPIAPVQQLDVPFTASLSARDDIGNTLTNYSGALALSGQFGNTNASAILISEFDTATDDKVEFVNASSHPVNISGWRIALYDSRYWPAPVLNLELPTNTVSYPGQTFMLWREGVAPGFYPNFFMGTNVSWNNGVLGNPVAIALFDNKSNVVDFVCAFDANPLAITNPAAIPVGQWVGSPLAANTNATSTYQRVGRRDTHSARDWVLQLATPAVIHTNLAVPFDPVALFAVSPKAVILSNGVWVGNITVPTLQSNMVLIAGDTNGHRAYSDGFSTVALNDLSVEALPPNIVAALGANIESTWLIRNSGAATAANVQLVNTLPASLSLVSATSSQGSCTISNGNLFCSLGSLGAGQTASVAVVLNAAQPGFVTNVAAITSAAPESWLSNNVASLLCQVNPPFLYSTNVTINEGNQGTTNAIFFVRLSAPAPVPVSVSYRTLPLTAVENSDYQPVSGTLTFAPGVTNLPVAVPVVGDRVYEMLENFFLAFSDPVNATLATPLVRCRINNDDTWPFVSIGDVTVRESEPGSVTNAVFNVWLNAPAGVPVWLEYMAVNGSAILDHDFNLSFGMLTFNPGVTNLEVIVPVKGDNVPESNEVFYVYLNNVFNGSFAKSSAIGTILDNGQASLDHFRISQVPSPQHTGRVFPVTISALDAWGRPFPGFPGTVELKGISSLQTFLAGTGAVAIPYPLGTSFHDGRTQVIYTTNELPQAGQITALSLQVTNPPGQTLSNWTVRMKHVPWSAYPSRPAWESGGWTTVYQRNQAINAPGWVTFYFDAPFAYDGTNNLLVDFTFDNTSYSSDGRILCSPSPTPRVLYGRSDSGFGDPLNWSAQHGPLARLTNQVPNARFVVESSVPVSPTMAGPFVQGVWNGEVTVNIPATNIFLRAVDRDGHAGSGNVFAVEGLATAPFESSRIFAIQPKTGSMEISFTTQPGLRYVVERTTDIGSGIWTPVETPTTGNGSVTTVLDKAPVLGGNCFYRVRSIR